MADNKKSFVLYKDWFKHVQKLSNDQAGSLFIAVLHFVNNKEPEIDDTIEPIYLVMTEQIVYEWSKFNPKNKKYHWNYKGGISTENMIIRNSQYIKSWRFNVFERDNYTCQNCNTRGGALHAHHIKPFAYYPDLRFDVSNGLTLCKECHHNVHRKTKTNG